MEIVYEKKEDELRSNNGRYAAIDLGINNLATVTSNVSRSYIVNGKPVKSINQYYNKKRAEYQSKYYQTHKKEIQERKRNLYYQRKAEKERF